MADEKEALLVFILCMGLIVPGFLAGGVVTLQGEVDSAGFACKQG